MGRARRPGGRRGENEPVSPLDAAKIFMAALDAGDADKAASVCADDVTVVLPGGETELQGKDAAKRLIRMAPPFIRRVREEEVHGNSVILRGLTRSPGHFANFTTWTFETDGDRIVHVSFAWRPAN
jgi:ketosteroid isomerase-like protein